MIVLNNNPSGGAEEERPARANEIPATVTYVRRPPEYLPMAPVRMAHAATRTEAREKQGDTIYDTLPKIYLRTDEDHG